jgi:diguanylate cyclase (GGDEF)-like protein
MKTFKITEIPIRLSLFIIICFGIVPSLFFMGFQYIDFKRKIEAGKALHLADIKQQLKMDVKIDYEVCTALHALKIKRLKQSIKSAMDIVFSMVETEYHMYEHTMKPLQIADLIYDQLQCIRLFSDGGYFFILSTKGKVKLYPPDLSQEGLSWFNLKGANGKRIIREMIHLAQTAGGGFLEYTWPVSKDPGKSRKKISYVRIFEPLNWIIGTGEYLENIENEIQEEVIEAKRQRNIMEDDITFILDLEGKLSVGKTLGHGNLSTTAIKQAIAQINSNNLKSSGDFFRITTIGKDGYEYDMLGFARYYLPWGWIGGKIINTNLLENRGDFLKNRLTKEMISEITFMLIALIFSIFFVLMAGKHFARQMKKHMSEFEAFFENASKEKEQINIEKIKFEELKTLGQTANAMVCKRIDQQEKIEQTNLKLRHANQRLKELANVDGLTNLANRRFFNGIIEKEWHRAAREKQSITLGMLDIDFFKRYNDTYGHQMGDDCLIKVGTVLKEAMRRPADLAARYGGEEFVILLPSTNLEGGKSIAESIRQQIQALNIPHSGSPFGRVSFSMGLACITPSPQKSSEYLLALADKALYKAKEARDQIICMKE